MDDSKIVDLYWARSDSAIAETAKKFGAYCRKIADNILHSAHDAEECENDTWLAAWNSMPQNRPDKLAPYLGRITRNLALDLRERQNAKKRGGGQTAFPHSPCPWRGRCSPSYNRPPSGRCRGRSLRKCPPP